MINKFFLKDKSFRIVSKIMDVEYPTLIEDMTLLLRFLLKPLTET